MKNHLMPILAAVLAAAATAGVATASHRGAHHAGRAGAHPYAIGLWGDLPYSDVQATVGVPNLIADMNRQSSRSPSTTAT